MAKVRRLVLDVMVPNIADVTKLAQDVADVKTVHGANILVSEIDKEVINLKVIVEGDNLKINEIEKVIAQHGGTIHSVDNVVAGKEIVEDVETPQD